MKARRHQMPTYYRPTSRHQALSALAEHGADARPLVGGTDLLVGLRDGAIDPALIVDLKAVSDFVDPIVVSDDRIVIGPTLTMGALSGHPVVRQRHPALAEAASIVGSIAIRNRASVIGNCCNASPGADTVPALLVEDAVITIETLAGERTVAADEFFLGPRRTLCGADALVTRIELHRPPADSSSAFARLTRRRGVDLATVSVAACVHRDNVVVLGLGAVGPRGLRTEFALAQDLGDVAALTAQLDAELRVATPISDVRGSEEYRTAMVRVLARRAVLAAARRRDERLSR